MSDAGERRVIMRRESGRVIDDLDRRGDVHGSVEERAAAATAARRQRGMRTERALSSGDDD